MKQLLQKIGDLLMLLVLLMTSVTLQAQPTMDGSNLVRTSHQAGKNVDWTQFAKEHPALRYYANSMQLMQQSTNVPDANRIPMFRASQQVAHTAGEQLREATFWGHVLHADNWSSTGQTSGYGLHTFTNKNFMNEVEVLENTNIYSCNMSAGGVYQDGVLYYINYTVYQWGDSKYLYSVDTSTDPWTQKNSTFLYDYYMFATAGVSIDPTTGTAYGIFSTADGQGKELGTVNYASAKRTCIATVEEDFVALAIDSEGQLFVIGEDGNLYKMDKTNGATTLVGPTGVTVAPYIQSATYDHVDGVLYWAAYTGSYGAFTSGLYTVDTKTGAATKLGAFPQNLQMSMLTVLAPLAEQDAPAAVDDLTLTFEGGKMNGTVAFTAPTTTYGGGALQGTLDYTVTLAGEPIRTGTVGVGKRVEHDIEITTGSGQYEFGVYVTNSVGRSPVTKKTTPVGFGMPYAPSDVKMTIDKESGVMNLTWNKANMCTPGEYLGEITFGVIRYPDNVLVANGLKENSFTETLDVISLKNYYYGVYQINGDMHSNEVKSNQQVIGQYIVAPYRETFLTEGDFNMWTLNDANKDGRVWQHGFPHEANIYTGEEYPADDWLISPPIMMEKGRQYTFSINTRCNYYNSPERFEVLLGTNPKDVSTFTTVVIEPTVVDEDDEEHGYVVMSDFDAPDDGLFYIGIHVISDAKSSLLYVNELELLAGAVLDSPGAVSDFVVTPAEMGELKATLEFVAPTLMRNGGKLSSIDRIEIYRNYLCIDTIFNPEVGAKYSYVDASPINGMNSYIVTAYNESGNGDPARLDAYVGVDIPLPHENLATERRVVDNFDGTFTLHWPVPNKGENGGYIDSENLIYNLYERGRYSYVPYKNGFKTPEATIDTLDYDSDLQVFTAYGITAVNSAGESQIFSSAPYILGKPYAMPFYDSFATAKLQMTWWSYTNGDCSWSLDARAYDNDGGVAVFTGNAEGASSTFFTGKLNISDCVSPYAVFQYRGADNATARLAIVVNRDFAVNDTLDIELTPTAEWQAATIDLSAYTDSHYIMFGILGIAGSRSGEEIMVDQVRVLDMQTENLAIESLSTPEYVRAGLEGSVIAGISNIGMNDAENFVLQLYVEDKLVNEVGVESLASNAQLNQEITFKASSMMPDEITAKVVIVWSQDSKAGDNEMSATIGVEKTELATVAIEGEKTEYGVKLSWDAPVVTADYVTESFEDYEPFIIDDFLPWTTIDADGAYTYSIQDFGIPNAGSPMAFQVFNLEVLESPYEIDPSAMPHSGDQYLISFNPAPIDDVIIDANDWLISPELPGIAQTISFYAKALTTQWGNETFEILYSTTGKEMDDFVKIGATREGKDEWTMFSAELPEGSKYFAIRVTSSNRFAFMLDDVSYYAGNAEIVGYNIYRDGEFVKCVAPDAVEGQDYPEEPGTYSWNVTVQYVAGESNPSNTFTSDVNGCQGVDALTAGNTKVWYNAAAKTLNVTSKNVIERVELYDMQGQLLHVEDAVAECNCTISMAAYSSAVYVVRTHTTDAITINRIVVR